MLVNDQELIPVFHQPVGIKDLPEDLIFIPSLSCQDLFFEQIHLYWFFYKNMVSSLDYIGSDFTID